MCRKLNALVVDDEAPAPKRLEISTTGKRYFVKHEDLLHIEACGGYSTVFLASGRIITISKNFERLDDMLDDPFLEVTIAKL